MNFLQVTDSPLGKAFEKQTKTMEESNYSDIANSTSNNSLSDIDSFVVYTKRMRRRN